MKKYMNDNAKIIDEKLDRMGSKIDQNAKIICKSQNL